MLCLCEIVRPGVCVVCGAPRRYVNFPPRLTQLSGLAVYFIIVVVVMLFISQLSLQSTLCIPVGLLGFMYFINFSWYGILSFCFARCFIRMLKCSYSLRTTHTTGEQLTNYPSWETFAVHSLSRHLWILCTFRWKQLRWKSKFQLYIYVVRSHQSAKNISIPIVAYALYGMIYW